MPVLSSCSSRVSRGYLCLHRTDDSSGFTESELALVATAAPHLGHALRQALLLHGPGRARPRTRRRRVARDSAIACAITFVESIQNIFACASCSKPCR
jgi:GAF domain-containing protein